MTSAEVISKANSGNIASPEMDLQSVLFDEILPEFLLDVGRVSWVMRPSSASVAANAQTFDLPSDCRRLDSVILPNASKPLPYIGEDPARVLQAEANTTAGTPTGWYYAPDADGVICKRVKFNCPLLESTTVRYIYRFRVVPAANIAVYVPVDYHAGLVAGVKREIYLDRWGIGDKRVEAAAQKFSEWKERVMSDRELAPAGNYVVRL